METPPTTPTSTQEGSSVGSGPSTKTARPIKAMKRPSSFRTPVAGPASPASPVNNVNPFSISMQSTTNPRNPFCAPLKRVNLPFHKREFKSDQTPRDRQIRRRKRKLSFRRQKRWAAPTPMAQSLSVPSCMVLPTMFPAPPSLTTYPNSIPVGAVDVPAVRPTAGPTPSAELANVLSTPRPYTVTLAPQTILPTGGLVKRPTESSSNSDSSGTNGTSYSPGSASPEEYEEAFEEICHGPQGYFNLPFSCNPFGPSQVALGKRRVSEPSEVARGKCCEAGPSEVALGKRRESFLGKTRPAPPRRRSTAGARPGPRLCRMPIRSRRQTDLGPMIANTEQLDPFVVNVDIHYQMLIKEIAEHGRLEGQIIYTMESLNDMTIAALDMTRENSRKLEAMKVRLEAQRRGQGSSSGMDHESDGELTPRLHVGRGSCIRGMRGSL